MTRGPALFQLISGTEASAQEAVSSCQVSRNRLFNNSFGDRPTICFNTGDSFPCFTVALENLCAASSAGETHACNSFSY